MYRTHLTSKGYDATEVYESYVSLTPRNSGRWGEVELCRNPTDADYVAGINRPADGVEPDPDRLVMLCREPPVYDHCEWRDIDAAVKIGPRYGEPMPQSWWIERSYDELRALGPDDVPKREQLSWVTTDKGRFERRFTETARRQLLRRGIWKHQRKPLDVLRPAVTDGHILRMDFLDRLVTDYPDLLDLYGRGVFSGPHYRGEVDDKLAALSDYRYTLAIENYEGPNYFSEKIADALLAWCLPIYWGCTNLDEYLPEDAYVRIDIERDDAPERVAAIVESDLRERRLDAIAEARHRILEEYQFMPVIERAIESIAT